MLCDLCILLTVCGVEVDSGLIAWFVLHCASSIEVVMGETLRLCATRPTVDADLSDEMMIRFLFVIVRSAQRFSTVHLVPRFFHPTIVLSFFLSGHLLYVPITCDSIHREFDDPFGSVGSATSLNIDSPRLTTVRRPWRSLQPAFLDSHPPLTTSPGAAREASSIARLKYIPRSDYNPVRLRYIQRGRADRNPVSSEHALADQLLYKSHSIRAKGAHLSMSNTI